MVLQTYVTGIGRWIVLSSSTRTQYLFRWGPQQTLRTAEPKWLEKPIQRCIRASALVKVSSMQCALMLMPITWAKLRLITQLQLLDLLSPSATIVWSNLVVTMRTRCSPSVSLVLGLLVLLLHQSALKLCWTTKMVHLHSHYMAHRSLAHSKSP